MLNEMIDADAVLCLGIIYFTGSCKLTEGNAEGNDLNCLCEGNLVGRSNEVSGY